MSRRLKKIALGVCCCALLSVVSMISVKADAQYFSYDTTTRTYMGTASNNTPTAGTLQVSTRPTAGTGGAVILIMKADGTQVASKTFPYQTDVSPLTTSVPSGELRQVYVEPNIAGQQIKGRITVYFE